MLRASNIGVMRRIFGVVVALGGLGLGAMVVMKAVDGTFSVNLWSSVFEASCSLLLLGFAGRIAFG